MKQILLQTITLHNWRGEKDRTTTFNLDTATYICGGNGLGKSRHFDAFCWLLFGKDSQDRKDYELRTRDAGGDTLHHCECSVTATLIVDGEMLELKREYKEQWVKPRGQIEEVFKGNITECTWDGTPVKVGDFNKRVQKDIIDDTLFKMLTNPRYFTERIKWTVARECLLQMAGTTTDEEIAATNTEFQKLLDTLNGKPLADYRKQIATEKKRLKAQADEIQPRIDQTQKMMPAAEDWDALTTQLEETRQAFEDTNKQIASKQERDAATAQQRQETRNKIYELQRKQRAAIEEYRKQQEQLAYEQNAARRDIEAQIKAVSTSISQTNTDGKRNSERTAYLNKQLASLQSDLENLRKEWYDINATQYTGSDTCPHCGQPLPEAMRANARQMFEDDKQERLKRNNEKGQYIVSQYKAYKAELEEKDNEAEQLNKKCDDLNEELERLYAQLREHPKAAAPAFTNNDVPGYDAMQKQIDALEASLMTKTDNSADDGTNALRERRKALSEELDSLTLRLARKELIDKANDEIVSLTKQGRTLAQQIADIEKREFIAAEFTKKKISDCERRINSMFRHVTFKLFDCTLDGNEFETCVPYVNGIPYTVTNTAGQVNAGLDIINTLCRFHNVCAPIFVDGAESVNSYNDVPSQMILLQVTKDKQLTIR